MNKEMYLEEWDKIQSRYRSEVLLHNQRLGELKELFTNFKLPLDKKMWICISGISVAVLVLAWLFGGSVMSVFISCVATFTALLLTWFIAYRVINKDLFFYNKTHMVDEMERRRIKQKLENLESKVKEDRYLLATQYSNNYLMDINVYKGFYATFKMSAATYGKKYNEETDEYDSGELLIKYDENVVSSVKSNQKWVDVRSQDIFILKEARTEYRKSNIIVRPNTSYSFAYFTSTNNSRGLTNFQVNKPSKSSKRLWSRKMPELNGEYYPHVSSHSSDIDVFKYFTPRVIDFFLSNANGDMVQSIENNTINFHNLETGYEWFNIPRLWNEKNPNDVIQEIESFAINKTHRGINLEFVERTLKDTDTLHR